MKSGVHDHSQMDKSRDETLPTIPDPDHSADPLIKRSCHHLTIHPERAIGAGLRRIWQCLTTTVLPQSITRTRG